MKRILLNLALINSSLGLLSTSLADDHKNLSYEAAVKRTEATPGFRNLKYIGLAFHNYHDVFGRFPPAVILGPDGKTPHSWRVELLPFIQQDRLKNLGIKDFYNREKYNAAITALGYDLNKTWDSEENRAVLQSIPDLYRHPSDEANSIHSGFYAIVGRGTAFDPAVIARYKKYPEPWLFRTVQVVESKSREPWTKPIDIRYSVDSVVPRLGGFTEGGFLTLSCVGAVHFVEDTVSPENIRGYFTKDVSDTLSIPGIPFQFD